MRDAVMASAPHMATRRPDTAQDNPGGGFDLSLDDGLDDLDGSFARRGTA